MSSNFPPSPHMLSRPGKQFASRLHFKSHSFGSQSPSTKAKPVLLPPAQLIALLDEQDKMNPAPKPKKTHLQLQASALFQTQSRQDYYQSTVRAT